MKIRFTGMGPGGDAIDVEYAAHQGVRVPIEGEQLSVDNTDPLFPEGLYIIGKPVWGLTLRGINSVTIPVSCRTHGHSVSS